MTEAVPEVVAETVAGALARGRATLIAADAIDAALDARLLLQAALGVDHAGLVAGMTDAMPAGATALYGRYLARRRAREPVSKILGTRDFHGRRFRVTADVLDPRPDTETLIELALGLEALPHRRVLDLGSGSGALICTLLAEWPLAAGTAVDLSPAALAVTGANAAALGVAGRLMLLHGSWFAPVTGLFDLIISNPPYIPAAEIAGLEPDVRDHDPWLALDGGDDGLSCYRLIAVGAGAHLLPAGHIIVEAGAGQATDIQAIFEREGFALASQRRDLGGHVRALCFVHAGRGCA